MNQVHLASLSYIFLLSSIFIPDKNEESYNLKKRLSAVVLMVIPCLLSVYSIYCMIVGKCHELAWYNSIYIFVWCVFIVLFCLKN